MIKFGFFVTINGTVGKIVEGFVLNCRQIAFFFVKKVISSALFN